MEVKGIFNNLPFDFNGYTFHSVIGVGSYGCVTKATNLKKNYEFAAKFICCDKSRKQMLKSAIAEFECLINVINPFIINIYDQFSYGKYLVLILELCTENFEVLINSGIKLKESQLLIIMKQLLTAIDHCHCKGIAHRDIKPANIFLSKPNTVKLGDFGLGLNLKEGKTTTNCNVTFILKAPELIMKVEHNPFKADIWSLGVTFYYFATGFYPWGKTEKVIEKNILKNKFVFPPKTPESVMQVINKMLVVDPKERLSAADLLKSECFEPIKLYSSIYKINEEMAHQMPLCLRLSPKKSVLARNGIKIAINSRKKRSFPLY